MRGRPGRPVQKRPATARIFVCQGEAAWLGGVSLHKFQAWRDAGWIRAGTLGIPGERKRNYILYRLSDVLELAAEERR